MKPPKKTKLNPTLDPKSPANIKKLSQKKPKTNATTNKKTSKLSKIKNLPKFKQLSLDFGQRLNNNNPPKSKPKPPPPPKPTPTRTGIVAVVNDKPKKLFRFNLKGFLWRWIIAPLLVIVIVFHLLVAGLLGIWKNYPVSNSMFMVTHRIGGGTVNQKWVDYENIAKSAKQAVIASEDGQFIYHNGFDFDSIEKALKKNEKLGKIQAGGSTITQQLAKNLFLSSHRSYIRKAEEVIITLMIEKMWDKKRILEVYLNVVEFGHGIYGIESASWHYFGKPARELTNAQSALLASMLTNPKYYQKNLNNPHLKKKQKVILKRLGSSPLPP
ncbi:monofunctional biosynthetic peptidoglycan transglycosylase [Moraxella oblonga]|uniref:monofunctional biosynthetic peptidoglycan transglycosylase n=1 Tax=Moraxella oblonga TaxID=200413 RepID=UPI000A061C13|nr:monofunctional biosynthetic peptidoglycan transglycosylase [Moraxella oblonga]